MTKPATPYRVALFAAALIPVAAAVGIAAPASADPTVDCSSFVFTQTADSLTVTGTVDLAAGDTNNTVALFLDNDPGNALDVDFLGDGPGTGTPFSVTATGIPAGQYAPILDFGFATNGDGGQECVFDSLTFAASSPTVPSAKTDALELEGSTSGSNAILGGGAALAGLAAAATGLLVLRSRRRSAAPRG